MKKTIYLIGLIYNNNQGDSIIFQSAKYMIEEIIKDRNDVEIQMIDLFGREPMGYSLIVEEIRAHVDDYAFNNKNEVKEFEVRKICDKICKEISKDNSCIIFAGGGIVKYIYEKFELYIDRITNYADEHSIPVMFNAVGIEGYNAEDISCIMLKNALNRECVKAISVRDDIETLIRSFEFKGFSRQVADPACCISKYVTKKHTDEIIVGINCARPELFKEYGVDYDRDQVKKLLASTAVFLVNRGYKCELFDNGTERDDKFVDEVLDYIGENDNVTRAVRPATGYELVKNISKYRAIVAVRLHASIVAFSCGVPFISIVWNNKQKFFCESISREGWYVERPDFAEKTIADKLISAIKLGYEGVDINKHCRGTIDFIEEFLNNNLF